MGNMTDRELKTLLQTFSDAPFKIFNINSTYLPHNFVLEIKHYSYSVAPSSQLCSCCGCRQKISLDIRTYICPKCGLIIDRDYNAALNIKEIGLKKYRAGTAPNKRLWRYLWNLVLPLGIRNKYLRQLSQKLRSL